MPTETPEFETRLAAFCARVLGAPGHFKSARRLTGGANMECWQVEYGAASFVLRRMPPNMDGEGGFDQLGPSREADLINAAYEGGVTVPKIIGKLCPGDDLGTGFLMQKIDGETLPHKIFKGEAFAPAIEQLLPGCARELAKIHALDIEPFTHALDAKSPLSQIDTLETRILALGLSDPIIGAALYWLRHNLPDKREPCILHGDFRMGNLMIGAGGITGVLDWELGHIGDPAQDLGYLCTPSWRFGHYDKVVGGFGDLDDLLRAYENASGRKIPAKDIHFWMIYSSLWWAMVCASMAQFWRSGADRSLERIIIGRRVSEGLIDVLLLLEEALPIAPARIEWQLPIAPPASGASQTPELLAALINWDTDHVIPHLKGRDLFQARVARNGLGILERASRLAAPFSAQSEGRLAALGLDQQALYQALASGSRSLPEPDITAHLRRAALEQLSIDQPRYAGFAAALKKWT